MINLGVIRSNDNKDWPGYTLIKRHRSLFKILVNPFLRMFLNKEIVSVASYDREKEVDKITEIMLQEYDKELPWFNFFYKLEEGETLSRERILY